MGYCRMDGFALSPSAPRGRVLGLNHIEARPEAGKIEEGQKRGKVCAGSAGKAGAGWPV